MSLDRDPPTQLGKLARRFPALYVESAPPGKYGDYVPHHVVQQALLATVGAFDMEVREIVRGGPRPDGSAPVEAVILRCTFAIDGRTVMVEEAGDVERPENWSTEGARLKDAISDALKRCAMRVGLGLHLWSGEHYFLDRSLAGKPAETT